MDDIIADFLVESYEGLDQLDQNLVALEDSPDDVAVIQEVFRTLHTIKGTCGFLGFVRLERLAHAGETLLSQLRDGKQAMSPAIADALLATVDEIRDILGTIDETEAEGEPDIGDLVDRLGALCRPDEKIADSAAAPETEFFDGTTDEPSTTTAPETEFFDGTTDEPTTTTAAETQFFDGTTDEPSTTTAPETEFFDGTTDRIGDKLVEQGFADRTDVEIAAAEQQFGDERPLGAILVEDGRADRADVESAVGGERVRTSDSTIRVDVQLLNRLMNLVGELVLSRNQIVQLAAEHANLEFGPPAQRLNLITSELQEGVMKTRMQPIDSVWGKLPRVVRDLSQQLGKQVRLEMIGKDTELDRTIIEAIKDPLTHIVRNTVDHGIEPPEDRIEAGKEPEGLLLLRANHEGGQVTIEITDDGRGISTAAIKQKAVERGQISAAAAEAMSEDEAVRLVFRPGFSTATAVSNVSGRGVGMDVVKTNIERIGGSVDVKTEHGLGTTFTLKIPLTLAIIPALTITCAGNRYAIPQLSLVELVRVDDQDRSQQIEILYDAPVYRLRGRLLPIVDLRQQLGCDPIEREWTNIVVLAADGQEFGLVVDGIDDTEEIVVKPLGRQVKDIELFSGATIMGDGRIALILDVFGLATRASVVGAGSAQRDVARSEALTTQAVETMDDRTLLLLALGDGHRAAVPLADVERLEEFPVEAIEISENRPVVQYRGKVIPVIDLAPAIGAPGSALAGDTTVSIVIYSFQGRTIGLAVAEIIDIVTDAEVPASSIGDGATKTVIIDDLVTDVVDIGGVVASTLPVSYIDEAAAAPGAVSGA